MESPYQVKRPTDANTGQLQEKELISLKDDSTKPPPTVGDPSGLGVYLGPLAGQPGSGLNTFEHSQSPGGKFLFSTRFWLLLAAVAIIGYFVYAFVKF